MNKLQNSSMNVTVLEKKLDFSDWGKIFETYNEMVHRLCIKYLGFGNIIADDMVMDTFMKAMNKIHQFDETKGQFSTWICTIARNECLNHIEKQQLNVSIDNKMKDTNDISFADLLTEENEESSYSLGVTNEAYSKLMDIINSIPDTNKNKLAFMHILNGFDYKSGAKLFGISDQGFRTRIKRFSDHIREKAGKDKIFKSFRKTNKNFGALNKKDSKNQDLIVVEKYIYKKGNSYIVYGQVDGQTQYIKSTLNFEEAKRIKQSL